MYKPLYPGLRFTTDGTDSRLYQLLKPAPGGWLCAPVLGGPCRLGRPKHFGEPYIRHLMTAYKEEA